MCRSYAKLWGEHRAAPTAQRRAEDPFRRPGQFRLIGSVCLESRVEGIWRVPQLISDVC